MKGIDLSGKKYGRWTVEKFSHKLNNRYYWLCTCECGKTTSVDGNSLKNGDSKSCGCLKSEQTSLRRYSGGKYITGLCLNNIKQGAKTRNLEFNITIKNIEDVYEAQNKLCFYTKIPLTFNTTRLNGKDGKIIAGNASVDRIDSSKGYIIDNIQIVHKDINMMKLDKSHDEFIQMCRDVVEYQEQLKEQSSQ